MLISDTLHYRSDGTVSGVLRVTRESYQTPSGRNVIEDVTSSVDLSAVTDVLDAAYAANEARHAELENQIANERDAAAAEKLSLTEAHTRVALAMAEEAREAARAASAEIAAKDAALAARDAALADALLAKDAEAVRG